jgi:hypothetical protein
MQDEILADEGPAPDFRGRGIVICAGGPRYFTCAWVLLQMLRKVLRSTLPIQIWYRGPGELDAPMSTLLRTLDNVELIDAATIPGYERLPFLWGWELKPFAIMNCSFREVILIDADNVPVIDPAVLFDTPQYAQTGAIFWPDFTPIQQDSAIWEMTRLSYRDEPSFESGQIVIDKLRCWKCMRLTMHMNEHSRYYCQPLYGDKDTFHFAWRMADRPYAMPSERPGCLWTQPDPAWGPTGPVVLQAGFDGNLIFQHRNWPKWYAFGENARYPGFLYESECLEFLSQLRELWDGKISNSKLPFPPKDLEKGVVGRWYRYIRVGDRERLFEFFPDHHVGGADEYERNWMVTNVDGKPVMELGNEERVTCRLAQDADGVWRGRWNFNEGFPVELIPLPPPPRPVTLTSSAPPANCQPE